MHKATKPLVVLGAGVLAVAGFIALGESPQEAAAAAATETRQRAEAMGAYGDPDSVAAACEESVLGRLKAPSTATFTEPDVDLADELWTVTGSVDAENSLGASLRQDYRCTVVVAASGSADVQVELLR